MATALTEAQIITLIRKGIRQYSTVTIKDADIAFSIETAIDILGEILVSSDPQYFTKLSVRQSDGLTNIFSTPDDIYRLSWVKDLGQKAGMITNATNASPIVITENNHGRVTGDRVQILGVSGNTAANGVWKITKVTDSTYLLFDSDGNGDYVATEYGYLYDNTGTAITDVSGNPVESAYGGLAFNPYDDYPLIYQTPEVNSSNTSLMQWYARGNQIIIDSPTFDNDILIGYVERPDSISDIPAEFHRIGLESFGIIDNLELPPNTDPKYPDYKASYDRHMGRWQLAQERASAWKFSTETRNVNLSQRVTRSQI